VQLTPACPIQRLRRVISARLASGAADGESRRTAVGLNGHRRCPCSRLRRRDPRSGQCGHPSLGVDLEQNLAVVVDGYRRSAGAALILLVATGEQEDVRPIFASGRQFSGLTELCKPLLPEGPHFAPQLVTHLALTHKSTNSFPSGYQYSFATIGYH
jgi:hypothetical protein